MFETNQRLKSVIKKSVPKSVLCKWWAISSRGAQRKIIKEAKNIFERAPETPIWLEREMLDSLQQKYPFPFTDEYRYDSQSLEKRGKQRAEEILKLIPTKAEKIKTCLEFGCWDGMVSCFLQRLGKITTAIDISSEGFNERAAREGVRLLQMDAACLKFAAESFDCVFSYASFEHFSDPASVLQEAIRVVKTGGYIFLSFGPPYMSPWGLHAWESITVPYCQFLFPREVLQDFANAKGLRAIDVYVNGWSLEDYRKLWDRYADRLRTCKYREAYDTSHLDLVRHYPSCFKSKTKHFESLIVDYIEVLFKKIPNTQAKALITGTNHIQLSRM